MKGDLTACEFHFEKTHVYVYSTPLYLNSLQIVCTGYNAFAHGLQFSSGSFPPAPRHSYWFGFFPSFKSFICLHKN